MSFDFNNLPPTLALVGGVSGDTYERSYRRYTPRWYHLCRHGASEVFIADPFPTHPAEGESRVIQRLTQLGCDEDLLLVTSRCLVCGKALLTGRLRQPDGTETSVGVQYIRTKERFTPAPKDIPDETLDEFYVRAWEFKKDLLADFNKLTIAVAVAASVFFDTHPAVFYAFIVTCFIMIALYGASYLGQWQISKKLYRDAGRTLRPTYKTFFDTASLYLQGIFGVGIVVVLCLMVRAERTNLMKRHDDDLAQKTRSYNPPTKTQDTRPFNPPKVEPKTVPPPEKTQIPQTKPDKKQE
jgi:hypothetical protein